MDYPSRRSVWRFISEFLWGPELEEEEDTGPVPIDVLASLPWGLIFGRALAKVGAAFLVTRLVREWFTPTWLGIPTELVALGFIALVGWEVYRVWDPSLVDELFPDDELLLAERLQRERRAVERLSEHGAEPAAARLLDSAGQAAAETERELLGLRLERLSDDVEAVRGYVDAEAKHTRLLRLAGDGAALLAEWRASASAATPAGRTATRQIEHLLTRLAEALDNGRGERLWEERAERQAVEVEGEG
ncbi:MAG: hypothetical protein HYU66_20130 [Armatimonadetes bacterium]|nr:hypothetical protein [Armatimonadota bacterium]